MESKLDQLLARIAELNKKIDVLSYPRWFQRSDRIAIGVLKSLKRVISGEIEYGNDLLFSNVIDHWFQDTRFFRKGSNKENISVETVLLRNSHILSFIGELRKQYGDKKMGELKAAPSIHSIPRFLDLKSEGVKQLSSISESEIVTKNLMTHHGTLQQFVFLLVQQLSRFNVDSNWVPILTSALESRQDLIQHFELEALVEYIIQALQMAKSKEKEGEITELKQLIAIIKFAIDDFVSQNMAEFTSVTSKESRFLATRGLYQTNPLHRQTQPQLVTHVTEDEESETDEPNIDSPNKDQQRTLL